MPSKINWKLYGWITLSLICLRWLVYIPQDMENASAIFWNQAWWLCFITAVTILFYEYLLPYIRKGMLQAIPAILLTIFLFTAGASLWRYLGIGIGIHTPLGSPEKSMSLGDHMANSLGGFLYISMIRHFYRYTQLKSTAKKLQLAKQAAELNYLKSQTNPHFLFNTLNNIYALALQKSDRTASSVMQLSKILRFMLYETNTPLIPIEKEVQIIQDYISLEKLRYDEQLTIRFDIDIQQPSTRIPPLLLIPLVENAFKHGSAETIEAPFVQIRLTVYNDQLNFDVQNSTGDSSPDEPIKENIGLSNIRRQLELLYTDYKLAYKKEGTVFKAHLYLNTKSHV